MITIYVFDQPIKLPPKFAPSFFADHKDLRFSKTARNTAQYIQRIESIYKAYPDAYLYKVNDQTGETTESYIVSDILWLSKLK